MIVLAIEEVDDLCKYCDMTFNMGPESLCEGRGCEAAYAKYVEEAKECQE